MKTFSHILFIIILSINANYLSAQNEWKLSNDSSSKIMDSEINIGYNYNLLNLRGFNDELSQNNLPELNNSIFGISLNLGFREVQGLGKYDHIHWRAGSKLTLQRRASDNDSIESLFRFGNATFNFSWDLLPKNERRSIFVGGGLGATQYIYNANSKNMVSFSNSLSSSLGTSIISKTDFTGSLLASVDLGGFSTFSISYNIIIVNGSWKHFGSRTQNRAKIEGGPNFGLGYLQLGLFTFF